MQRNAALGLDFQSAEDGAMIQLGMQQIGSYRIIDKLGTGAIAEVFTAELLGDAGDKRRVVLKRALAGLADDPQFSAMFLSEAKRASWLNHPNVVRVSDVSRDEEGRPFLVMEHFHGPDLGRLMDAAPIPPSSIIYLLTEVCRGLDHAHNAIDPTTGKPIGMLHCDVKPHNVLISYEGKVAVADFGLAKMLGPSGRAHGSRTAATTHYMSPEQCRGLDLDRTADLWAVGVMAHEMLTGQPLFAGRPSEIMAQVIFKDVPRPSGSACRIPADLEAVVMRLLSHDLVARFSTADAVIQALVACEDTPRDGRGELARFLAEHFPESTMRLRSSTPDHGST